MARTITFTSVTITDAGGTNNPLSYPIDVDSRELGLEPEYFEFNDEQQKLYKTKANISFRCLNVGILNDARVNQAVGTGGRMTFNGVAGSVNLVIDAQINAVYQIEDYEFALVTLSKSTANAGASGFGAFTRTTA
jgi:hypothetical protein